MTAPRSLALALLAWPGLGLAADGEALDLRGGAVGELTARTLGIAHALLAFLLVLGLVLQLLRGPGQRRRYLAVVWRTLVVLGLLQAYTFLAGSLVKQCTSLADSLAPRDAGPPLQQYQSSVSQRFAQSPGPDAAAATSASDEAKPAGVGGYLFDAGISLLILLAGAIHWVFSELSRILIAFFYAVGPLAVVFYVPGADTAGRWLRCLITVCCWPVVSSVLLHLSTSIVQPASAGGPGAGTTFGAVASSLLLCVLAFATPRIASAMVGGVGNLLAEGASTALRVASGAAAAGVLP